MLKFVWTDGKDIPLGELRGSQGQGRMREMIVQELNSTDVSPTVLSVPDRLSSHREAGLLFTHLRTFRMDTC